MFLIHKRAFFVYSFPTTTLTEFHDTTLIRSRTAYAERVVITAEKRNRLTEIERHWFIAPKALLIRPREAPENPKKGLWHRVGCHRWDSKSCQRKFVIPVRI